MQYNVNIILILKNQLFVNLVGILVVYGIYVTQLVLIIRIIRYSYPDKYKMRRLATTINFIIKFNN